MYADCRKDPPLVPQVACLGNASGPTITSWVMIWMNTWNGTSLGVCYRSTHTFFVGHSRNPTIPAITLQQLEVYTRIKEFACHVIIPVNEAFFHQAKKIKTFSFGCWDIKPRKGAREILTDKLAEECHGINRFVSPTNHCSVTKPVQTYFVWSQPRVPLDEELKIAKEADMRIGWT